jgi:hypothetical protein
MYRAALEHLLFEQGYEKGMCNAKLTALEEDSKAGKGPQWARDIDRKFLIVLKRLGDGALHPNDGDVGKQESLDEKLLRAIQATFTELLYQVYERPHEESERLAVLEKAHSDLKD